MYSYNFGNIRTSPTILPYPREDKLESLKSLGFEFNEMLDDVMCNAKLPNDWTLVCEHHEEMSENYRIIDKDLVESVEIFWGTKGDAGASIRPIYLNSFRTLNLEEVELDLNNVYQRKPNLKKELIELLNCYILQSRYKNNEYTLKYLSDVESHPLFNPDEELLVQKYEEPRECYEPMRVKVGDLPVNVYMNLKNILATKDLVFVEPNDSFIWNVK